MYNTKRSIDPFFASSLPISFLGRVTPALFSFHPKQDLSFQTEQNNCSSYSLLKVVYKGDIRNYVDSNVTRMGEEKWNIFVDFGRIGLENL